MMSNLAGLSAFKFVIVCSQKEQIVCATSESETSTEVSVMSIVTSSKAMETRALSNDSACSDCSTGCVTIEPSYVKVRC